MSSKIVFLAALCLIKGAFSQCYGANPAVVAEKLGLFGAGAAGPAGGPLLLQSYSMPPTGLSVASDDLIIDGIVAVSGRLPFLGSVAVEGLLPTAGEGAVVYGCGNGEVGIVESGGPGYGYPGPLVGPGPGIVGPGPALVGPGPAIVGPGPAIVGPGNAFGSIAPAFAPGFAPLTAPCVGVPQIDPGMAAAANSAAVAAAADAAGRAAVSTAIGLGAAANAAGLTAIAGL